MDRMPKSDALKNTQKTIASITKEFNKPSGKLLEYINNLAIHYSELKIH